MKNLILISSLFLISSLYAQKTLPKFGKIDKAELELKECSFETAAPAMILFNVFDVEMEAFEQIKIVTENRVRIKIFNEKGFEHANIRIPYFNEKRSTKIRDFEAVIYNLDEKGNVVIDKLDKKDLFKHTISKNTKALSFTFPNVKKGSVIEYRYTKIEKDIVNLDAWVVQDVIPTAYAATSLTVPQRFGLYTKTFGMDTIPYVEHVLHPERNYPSQKRFYSKENIRSFKSEKFMTSQKDNLLKMIFTVRPSKSVLMEKPEMGWKNLGSSLMHDRYFGKQFSVYIPGTQKVVDSAKKIESLSGRIEFIYERIKSQVPEISGYSAFAEDLEGAWNDGQGTSGEVNLMLLNLLSKAGVPCYPILVSTRNNGLIAMDFPSMSQINNVVILAVDNDNVYVLDASQKLPYNLPPANLMNRHAYLINPGNMKWVLIEDNRFLNSTSFSIKAEVDANGQAKGEAVFEMEGFARDLIEDSIAKDETDKLFASRQTGVQILWVENDKEDLKKPARQSLKFEYKLNNDGTYYYFTPQFLGAQDENPFINQSRQTDIDFGSNQKFVTELRIKIADQFKWEHLPQNLLLRSSDSSMMFKRIIQKNGNEIIYKQEMEISKSFFWKDEYPAIYEFFDKMFSYLKEEIVFRKP